MGRSPRDASPDDGRTGAGGAGPVVEGEAASAPRLAHGEAAELQFEERDGYLHAHASGERDSLAVSLDYWTRIFEECQRRGATRLLVEETFQNQLGTVDMFDLSARMSVVPTAPGLKIAFLDREPSHRELNEFGGTVAANRGISVRIVASVEEAEGWLRGS